MVLKPVTAGSRLVSITAALLVAATLPATAIAQEAAASKAGGAHPGSQHDYLADVGAKLSNPISDVWAHFTQFGLEYSVVNQDFFGQRFQIKLNIIPVFQSLIKSSILGSG